MLPLYQQRPSPEFCTLSLYARSMSWTDREGKKSLQIYLKAYKCLAVDLDLPSRGSLLVHNHYDKHPIMANKVIQVPFKDVLNWWQSCHQVIYSNVWQSAAQFSTDGYMSLVGCPYCGAQLGPRLRKGVDWSPGASSDCSMPRQIGPLVDLGPVY